MREQVECLLLCWSDQIRPDWEAKLAAVRAQAQRRANRRIIMRQVGDRLIPVGVTSGRVHALTEDGGDAEGSRSGSRRRRRNQGPNPTLDRFLGQVDIAGQDLEEVSLQVPHATNFASVLTGFLAAYDNGGYATVSRRTRATTATSTGGRRAESAEWGN